MPIERTHLDVPFEIKGDDVKSDGSFIGFGSTFGGKPDSYNDVVVAGAFANTIKNGGRSGNGVAMLWQHRSGEPIGVWEQLEENKRGLKVHGQLTLGVQKADEALKLLKSGAIKGLSIGFDTVESEVKNPDAEWDKRIRLLKEIDLWEISLVTFPANTRAKITSVKEMRTERDLEHYLRESGTLSKSAAQYLVKLCRPSLLAMRDSNPEGPTMMESILDGLKQMNIK